MSHSRMSRTIVATPFILVLVAMFVIAFASTAFAASVTPTDSALFTPSAWTYADLADVSAKYEGGYAAFDHSTVATWYANPHGGYDTATNKCKVCHAVHRAEGAYYLLRADSQDDACDYCHIGGSAHSSKVVYDLNSAGKGTNNGHTIGASTYIPDSTVAQWTEPVVLETLDENGQPVSETIDVRAYSEEKAAMYRFARHHGHQAPGVGRRGYVKIGPLALRCMSCHQVHNAAEMVWTPARVIDGYGATWTNTTPQTFASYKLLKAYPSGTTAGVPNSYGMYDASQAVRVPETTLTANVNFSTTAGMSFVVAATGRRAPNWVAQDFAGVSTFTPANRSNPCADCHAGHGSPYVYNSEGEKQRPYAVNNTAFSVWCADCHNLNIGYSLDLSNPELGFRAHTERTHPAPFVGGHGGPGQCYSCHRNDLERKAGSCSQCHYGTGDYYRQRIETPSATHVDSDFPHSGEDGDYKMLGSYSIVRTDLAVSTNIDENVVVGPDNLDAVCIRCHGGVGTFH